MFHFFLSLSEVAWRLPAEAACGGCLPLAPFPLLELTLAFLRTRQTRECHFARRNHFYISERGTKSSGLCILVFAWHNGACSGLGGGCTDFAVCTKFEGIPPRAPAKPCEPTMNHCELTSNHHESTSNLPIAHYYKPIANPPRHHRKPPREPPRAPAS